MKGELADGKAVGSCGFFVGKKTVGEAALLLVNLFIKGNLLMAGLLLSAGEKGRGHGCPALGQLVPCFVQCYQGRDRHWRLGVAETWSSCTG